MTSTEPALIHDVNWNLDYKVRLGRAWSKFMRGLQDGVIRASRCDDCARTFVPPQTYCESCFAPIKDWREVPATGTLRAATIVYQGFEGGPEAPYAVGAIQVDETDTLLMHFIGGVDLSDQESARAALANGTRVRAVWAEDRNGEITDIAHFVVDSDA
jgi:uncharacterized OB-fold protein